MHPTLVEQAIFTYTLPLLSERNTLLHGEQQSKIRLDRPYDPTAHKILSLPFSQAERLPNRKAKMRRDRLYDPSAHKTLSVLLDAT